MTVKEKSFSPGYRSAPSWTEVNSVSAVLAAANRFLRFLRCLLSSSSINFMHLLFEKADQLSRTVIGAAIEVHR